MMTAEPGLGISDPFLRRVFQCCQGLLIGLVCIAFLADFFAKTMFSLDLLALGLPAALLLLVVAVVTSAGLSVVGGGGRSQRGRKLLRGKAA